MLHMDIPSDIHVDIHILMGISTCRYLNAAAAPAPRTTCAICTQCSNSEWFARSCTLDGDSSCLPCGDCDPGYCITGFCVKGDSIPLFQNNRLAPPRSQPNRCDPCPPCKNGTFLSDFGWVHQQQSAHMQRVFELLG